MDLKRRMAGDGMRRCERRGYLRERLTLFERKTVFWSTHAESGTVNEVNEFILRPTARLTPVGE